MRIGQVHSYATLRFNWMVMKKTSLSRSAVNTAVSCSVRPVATITQIETELERAPLNNGRDSIACCSSTEN